MAGCSETPTGLIMRHSMIVSWNSSRIQTIGSWSISWTGGISKNYIIHVLVLIFFFDREVALVRSHKNAKNSAENDEEDEDPDILDSDAILAQAAEDLNREDEEVDHDGIDGA